MTLFGTTWYRCSKILLVCFPVLLVGVLASPLRAEDVSNFPKGTWTLTTYGAFSRSFVGEQAKIGSGTIGFGYYPFDNFSINAELSGYHNEQDGPDANIANFEALIRHHLWHSGRVSWFIDGGAGLSYADHRTPSYGTYYNYILELGTGATFQIHDNIYLLGGIRYFHLSNAELEGPLHNPGINAGQAYIGLLLKF